MKLQYEDLVFSQEDEDKICDLLECDKDELLALYRNNNSIFNDKDSFYNVLLKILQQGYNVREATLSGILVGYLLGYRNAEEEMEQQIKNKLFDAFKNNRPFK